MAFDETKLLYSFTNEDLDSVVAGLDPQPEDAILAVCGSGDQSFALLERALTVVSLDINPHQILYAQNQLEKIVCGDFDDFRTISVKGKYNLARGKREEGYFSEDILNRSKYFTDEKLKKIQSKKRNIRFEVCDVFKEAQTGIYNKFYFSNADFIKFTIHLSPVDLQRIVDVSPIDSLFYFTTKETIYSFIRDDVLPKELSFDMKKTHEAKKYISKKEFVDTIFEPIVLRKKGVSYE
jgi:hypothetical protein